MPDHLGPAGAALRTPRPLLEFMLRNPGRHLIRAQVDRVPAGPAGDRDVGGAGGDEHGPMTSPALFACVAEASPAIPQRAAYIRTGQVLARLKLAGKVRRDGGLWGLAQ